MPKPVKRRPKPKSHRTAQELERIAIRRRMNDAVRREREIRALTKRLDTLLSIVDLELFGLARTIVERDGHFVVVEHRPAVANG